MAQLVKSQKPHQPLLLGLHDLAAVVAGLQLLSMDQPFAHTLSFDDLEVLVLVENGGATPREVADSLGMDLEEAKELFYDLVGRGLLTCQDESTTFLLTPLARSLRNDEAFRAAAFAAAITGAGANNQG
jgi:hypothetical protein